MTSSAGPAAAAVGGILRRPSIDGQRSGSPLRVGGVGVHFAPPANLSALLAEPNFPALDGLMTHMRNQRGDALVSWLQALSQDVVLLKPKLEPFVLATLNIAWADKEKPIVAAFTHYLTNLMTAQSFYTKPIMMMMLRHLAVADKSLGASGQAAFTENVHATIRTLMRCSPLACRVALMQYAGKESLPYMLTPDLEAHTTYLKNLLEVSFYVEEDDDRLRLLTIVVNRLVQLDAYLPKLEEEEEEEEEADEGPFEMELASAAARPPPPMDDASVAQRNLDAGMAVLFQAVEDRFGRGAGARKSLWRDLVAVFDSHMLPTSSTAHVQFAVFRFLALDADRGGDTYTAVFLDWLWKKFGNPNTPGILRQAAVCYIASLVARGKFVSLAVTKDYLSAIMSWTHAYVSNREERSSQKKSSDPFFCDLKAHGPYYAACQAAFYIFAFRHGEFVAGGRPELDFLSRLGFQQAVTSPLNPLRVMMPSVVSNFAALSRHLQLAYCDAVLARNARVSLPVVASLRSTSASKPLLLDSFFPFDPYLLEKSRVFVDDSYRTYNGALMTASNGEAAADEEENEEAMEDVEDEEDAFAASLSKDGAREEKADALLRQFTYGTSPGFMAS